MTFNHLRGHRCAGSSERGETLIELLATLFLMSVTIIGLITATFTLVTSSARFNRSTRANVSVHEVAEVMKGHVADHEYMPCVKPSGQSPSYPTVIDGTASLPTDWTAKVIKVEWWDGSMSADASVVWRQDSSCTTSAEKGLQRLTIEVASNDGSQFPVDQTLTLVKRDTRCFAHRSSYANPDGRPC